MMDEDIDQKTNTIGYELNKSTKDLFSKLKIGIKKNLGKSFDKVGGSVVKGLNIAVSLPTKLIGSVGTKWVAPVIIIFFLVFILIFNSSQTSGNTPALVPKVDSGEGVDSEGGEDGEGVDSEGGEDGEGVDGGGEIIPPPVYGQITTLADGRIRSCGVGMQADFKRRYHNTHVTPALLAGGNYNKQLEEAIGDQFGKRCGVVYAAQYLTYDFKYWVPYSRDSFDSKGLNPKWGGPVTDIKHPNRGLQCNTFIKWAQINGVGHVVGSNTGVSFGNCETIKGMIEPGDTITLEDPETGYHIAMVLEYDNEKIKFGHAGGGYSGVTTGWIDICSGKGIDQGMQFQWLHKRYY